MLSVLHALRKIPRNSGASVGLRMSTIASMVGSCERGAGCKIRTRQGFRGQAHHVISCRRECVRAWRVRAYQVAASHLLLPEAFTANDCRVTVTPRLRLRMEQNLRYKELGAAALAHAHRLCSSIAAICGRGRGRACVSGGVGNFRTAGPCVARKGEEQRVVLGGQYLAYV